MRRRGFTLLEVVFAVAIVATSLLALQAAIAGSVQVATDTVNRRAARALARTKIEEVLTGVVDAEGSGNFSEEGYEVFTWSSRAEDMPVGGAGETEASENVRLVTVTISFPSDEGDNGRDTLELVSVMPAEDEAAGP